DGGLTNLPRGIDEYLERRRVAGAAGDSGKISRAASGAASGSAGVAAPAVLDLSSGEQRELQKEMNKLERQMQKLSQREEKLHADLAAAAGEVLDTEKLAALDRDLQTVVAEKEELEERWMEIGEQLEG
ncbi:ABC transporter C-terminal domain-containing protein, partial [Dietzia sp. NPDC055343]